MLFSLVSGLYLWWPLKRVRIHGPWRSKRFWYDLHNAIGIFSLVPVLVLAATGSAIGFEEQIASLLDKVTKSRVVDASPDAGPVEHEPGALQITPDRAVEIADARFPGTLAYRVQMPRYGGQYQVGLVNPSNRILGGRNSISIDPWTGNILAASLGTDMSLRERLMAWNEAIHTGGVFGITSRIVAAAASILLPVQVVSGWIIWLRRSQLLYTSKSNERSHETVYSDLDDLGGSRHGR
jgi:uncharacterized iron-regulated membrane protein